MTAEKEPDGCVMGLICFVLGGVVGVYLGVEVLKPRQAARVAAECALHFRSAGDTEVDTLRVLVAHDECKHFYRARP